MNYILAGMFVLIWLIGFPMERIARRRRLKRRIKFNALDDKWVRYAIEQRAALLRHKKEQELKYKQF